LFINGAAFDDSIIYWYFHYFVLYNYNILHGFSLKFAGLSQWVIA